MARIYFMPFNQEGEPVKRAASSMRDNASREAVAERVAACARKEGVGKIVHVEVRDAGDRLISAWDVRADCVVQTDGPGSENFERARIPAQTWPQDVANNSENDTMTEDAKKNPAVADGGAKADAAAAKADKKAAKEAAPKADKGPSKKDIVLGMLKDRAAYKNGVTLDDIQSKLNVTAAAARALIGDCQRIEGVTVKREKVEGVSRYTA
jgi:hypothetical protein